ncbi:MAG: N-acetylmuramoyl-L-alanine amidase [Candidatus Nomurabacteria bacterium]|nr:N-acetylmuramoyl-L-alanine amidase [Candidatus Nomurabacteria bacterium]
MKKFFFAIAIFIFLAISASCVKASAPIRILLVPGHDNAVWGAEYGNLKEAAMNLALASRIYDILKKDKRFEVYITRDKNGYTKEFVDYFANNQADVLAFKDDAKKKMQKEITDGTFVKKTNAPHNSVSEDVAIRLYGFNKWADENKIDAMIHVHFNDRPRPNVWTKGKEKGFVIYMPDSQFANSAKSVDLAKSVFAELHKKYITSTYEKEKGGLISDQKLIALGANGTLLSSVRSILIEYGYIYSLGNSTARQKKYDDMAKLTVVGIQNYFFK